MKYWIVTHDNLGGDYPSYYMVTTNDEDLTKDSRGEIFEGEMLDTPLIKRLVEHTGMSITDGDWVAIEPIDPPDNLKPENTFEVAGSWGILTVNRDTGYVRDYDDQDTRRIEIGDQYEDGYTNIVRFDLGEYRENWRKDIPDQVDILDLCYWTEEDVYETHARDRYENIDN